MRTSSKSQFRDGTERVDSLLARPDVSEHIDEVRAEMRDADQAHAMSLAVVLHAAQLTQAELGRALRVSQGAVAQTEGRADMLLSTLKSYVEATGAALRLLVELPDGRSVQLSLDSSTPAPHYSHLTKTDSDDGGTSDAPAGQSQASVIPISTGGTRMSASSRKKATSATVASKASKALGDGRSSARTKSIAASALSQAKGTKKK